MISLPKCIHNMIRITIINQYEVSCRYDMTLKNCIYNNSSRYIKERRNIDLEGRKYFPTSSCLRCIRHHNLPLIKVHSRHFFLHKMHQVALSCRTLGESEIKIIICIGKYVWVLWQGFFPAKDVYLPDLNSYRCTQLPI